MFLSKHIITLHVYIIMELGVRLRISFNTYVLNYGYTCMSDQMPAYMYVYRRFIN